MTHKGYRILAVLMAAVILCGARGTVLSKERASGGRGEQNRRYAALEEEYRERTQALLEQEGYHNCGINLTWVAYEDGSRQYTLLLHHRKLERLSDAEKDSLTRTLAQTEFQTQACSFRYEL